MVNIGDKVFINFYGAGIVLDIGDKDFFCEKKTYVTIYLITDDMDISIPIENMDNYKIRQISTKEQIEQALIILKQEVTFIEKNWNKRYRINNDKIDEGNIFSECEVIRDLKCIKALNMLPLGEEKILNKAQNMLASELMMVLKVSYKEAMNKIE